MQDSEALPAVPSVNLPVIKPQALFAPVAALGVDTVVAPIVNPVAAPLVQPVATTVTASETVPKLLITPVVQPFPASVDQGLADKTPVGEWRPISAVLLCCRVLLLIISVQSSTRRTL